MNRRRFLQFGALAPLAPAAAAVSTKLGTIGTSVQKVTPQMAVKDLLANYARQTRPDNRIVVNAVEYVGDRLALVRATTYWQGWGPAAVGEVSKWSSGSYVTRAVFNTGSEAVRYMGQIISPGQWVHLG